ncbi:MAG TPA: pyridoxal 5'-phosphate synthase lyase subunit PdxS, partial [Myxococcaceae bacterium]|nr:pyridoxal 5'-phosphate synthase lyase subunit PdxS [Myxococcaceae bacterium]
AEAVFVGSAIFLSAEPAKRAKAIVDAITFWKEPRKLAEVSAGLGDAMRGLEIAALPQSERFAARGW